MKKVQRDSQQYPLISIGMPVRNEAKFLDAALAALVGQTGVNLEIIISDNASTDATESICRRYTGQYPFIRYYRFEQNVGASTNFRFVLQEAKGAYFMWASGHDLWDSNYLQECSSALQANPGAILAFGTTRWIGADGNPFPRSWGWSDTRGLSVVGRYCTVFWGNMNPILGLMRTRDIQQQIFDDMVGVDLAILLALALRGDFMHIGQAGWCRREFRKEVSYQQKLERYRSADYALSTAFMGRYFPLARLPFRIIGDVLASAATAWQKFQLILILQASLPVKYFVDKARKNAESRESDSAPQTGRKEDAGSP